ncbi:DUF4127 family protein [Roseiflexus sp.]|uniref:DUF4127 family protein n=2 Tax=Roseiflexus sp. TaxID=2562120 RepID=UPI00398A55D3
MRVGLLPLDERPVNIRYPAMIAAIAGIELALPPDDLLSNLREPARCSDLVAWLQAIAPAVDALIVDVEMLAFGGLIASRISDDPPGSALSRLDTLRTIKNELPGLPILAFNVITRISNADASTEEPLYWATYGTRLYRLSQLLDRAAQGEPLTDEIAALRAEIPAEAVRDMLRRRLRNHIVNLASLHLLDSGAIDLLVLSSDDTSPFGLGSREKRWLASWADLLAPDGRENAAGSSGVLLMYPGADEVGCTLLARIINQHAGRAPRIAPLYAIPGGEDVVAPYEDGPVRLTIERQIHAIGGTVASADGDPDLWLAVNTPSPRRTEWDETFAAEERDERYNHLDALVERVSELQESGRQVIVADVAYPNGADPVLMELLIEKVDLLRLAGFGAWNTAGNTIGTALAQGCAALLATTPAQRIAHLRFLLHRFVEDWGYQHVVRRAAHAMLERTAGAHEPDDTTIGAICRWIETHLNARIGALPGFAGHWRITPGSTHLPWRRLFEVDFALEMV